MNTLPMALLLSLLLTLVLEAAVLLLSGKRSRRDFLLLLLVNLLTNPVVVVGYWLAVLHTSWNAIAVKAALETFAILTEAHYYRRYAESIRRPLLFSLLANGASFLIGLVLQSII